MKRSVAWMLVALFGLALGGGGLLAQGANDDLRERVRALRRELGAMARVEQEAAPETRFYDVGALVAPTPESADRPRDLRYRDSASDARAGVDLPEEPGEFRGAWSPDAVLEMAQRIAGESAVVAYQPGGLSVWAPRQAQRQVGRLLTELAKHPLEQFTVEIAVVAAERSDESLLDESLRVVSDALARQLEDRANLAAAEVRCTSGAMQAFVARTQSGYVADYDAEITREAMIGDPRPEAFAEGLSGDVLLGSDPRADGVLAHVRLHWQRRAGPVRSVDTAHGAVDLPAIDIVRLHTSLWLPLGRPVLLASCTRGVTPCHLMLRVRRSAPRG